MYLLVVRRSGTPVSLGMLTTFDDVFVKAVSMGLKSYEIWNPNDGMRRDMSLTFPDIYPCDESRGIR